MLKNILIVGCGSFAGGALRYLVSYLMRNQQGFPYATLLVNMAGCFLIGLLAALFSKYDNFNHTWVLLSVTGFCGGFTTFSTFAYESLAMLNTGQYISFAAYTIGSILLGILAVTAGYAIFR